LNRSSHAETIEDAAMLSYLIFLTFESLQGCPNPAAVLSAQGAGQLPLTIKPKKKWVVVYDVTYDCANDPAGSTRSDPGHEDFRTLISVDRSALDGDADTEPANDDCPRAPNGSDKGCGAKDQTTRQLGADILTDVVVKLRVGAALRVRERRRAVTLPF
jgi:hypothetical protein